MQARIPRSATKIAGKKRTMRRQAEINPADLPPEPDPARLPRLATRKQLAAIHARYFGPLSPRTLEALPIPYRRLPGMPALYETAAFLDWARARIEGAAVLIGGKRGRRA
ncbi:MAG: hypothetical protein IT557_14135 [Alphaproteobacteria bacterium]|nr:hypothetical protein [Alphaproteobacteria bacterium]